MKSYVNCRQILFFFLKQSPGKSRWRTNLSLVQGHALAVHIFFILLFVLLLTNDVRAEEWRGYFETSGGYKTGDFGTQTRTDLYYLSLELGCFSSTYDVSVTVPYLFLSDDASEQTGSTSDNGIGDVILRGGMVLVPEGDMGFSMDAALAGKIPTASNDNALGSGEMDYGAFMDFQQRFGKIRISLIPGYIKIGDPPSQNYKDIYLYRIGISRTFSRINIYTAFENRTSTLSGAKNPKEINAGLFYMINEQYSIKGNSFFGLNDGGPSFGASAGWVVWF